jgi:hypothetical protein
MGEDIEEESGEELVVTILTMLELDEEVYAARE